NAVDHAGQPRTWQERRLVVRSLALAVRQEQSLRQRVARAVTEINALDERKQGKPRVLDAPAASHAAAAIIAKHRVEGLVSVTVTTDVYEHVKRRYGSRPATTVRSERVRVHAAERGGTARRRSAAPGLARLCDQSYCQGDELGTGRGGLSQRVPDRTRLRAVERACVVADTVVFAVRPSGRWVALPVEHRAARVGADAIRCAAQSAASRRAAQRHLSRPTRTADDTA